MNDIPQSEIKCFKIKYIFHLVSCAIIILFNFILISKIIWIKVFIYFIYLGLSYFCILYFISPILSLILAILKKINKENISKLRLLNLIFCVLAIIVGFFLVISLLINTIESSDFCKECPFNIKINDINNKNICINRICLLNSENKENTYQYEYICNLDPSKYFDEKGPFKRGLNESFTIESNNEIECKKYELGYIIENDIINRYINFCGSNKELYICKRFSKPKYYNIKENFKCPEDNYSKILYMFCILNIFINLVLSFIPWRIEIVSYDKIILHTRRNNMASNNLSLNSTIDNSKVDNENKEENFQKVQTQVIILCNNNNLNINENRNNININNIQNENNQYIHTENCNHITNSNNKNKDNIKYKTCDEELNSKNNNISNPQSSSEIFILEDNKKINKKKNKTSKINNNI